MLRTIILSLFFLFSITIQKTFATTYHETTNKHVAITVSQKRSIEKHAVFDVGKSRKPKNQDVSGSYRVFGKRYYVLASSKNYEEKGVASWYGTQFHRRRTSSGERYNMYSMTAAHKSLPLSTVVLVTNLLNGRKVIVKINDRGPFISNRIIDLSYAAAKKLRMVDRGVVKVNVKALYTV